MEKSSFAQSMDLFIGCRRTELGCGKVIETPISLVRGVSPDGQWLVVAAGESFVCPTRGGELFRLGGDMVVGWTPDHRHFWIGIGQGGMLRPEPRT
jgi:hypothetical protein